MTTETRHRLPVAAAAVAAVVLAHLLGALGALDAPERLAHVHELMDGVGSTLHILGPLAAALAFSRGDHLRRVWAWTAVGAALLLLGSGLRSVWAHAVPDVPFGASPLLPYRTVVVIASNAASVLALALLAQTYRRSGLQSRATWAGRLLLAACGVAAVAFVLPQALADVRRLGAGTADTCTALINLASIGGDVAYVLLVVPLLRAAYMLRGGRLARVWGLMGLSGVTWLVYDMAEPLAAALPGNAAHTLELLEVLRTAAMVLTALAGWMQREALAPQRAAGIGPVLGASPGAL